MRMCPSDLRVCFFVHLSIRLHLTDYATLLRLSNDFHGHKYDDERPILV